MKTLKLILFGTALFIAGALQAQVSVNVHLGRAPQWGPVGHSEARYYYLPDVEAYYDIQTSRFIYYDGRTWVHRTYLPARYRNYDLYSGYKVVMTDYRGNTPYLHHKDYKMKYAKGYRGQAQRNIGERPGRGNSRQIIRSDNRPNVINRPNNQSNRNVGKDNKGGNNKNDGRGNDKKDDRR